MKPWRVDGGCGRRGRIGSCLVPRALRLAAIVAVLALSVEGTPPAVAQETPPPGDTVPAEKGIRPGKAAVPVEKPGTAGDGTAAPGKGPERPAPKKAPAKKKRFKAPASPAGGCDGNIRPKKSHATFGPGEAIYYIVTVKDIPVGKALIKLESVNDVGGRKVQRATARGRTNSFFSKVHKVRASMEEDADAVTGLPISLREDVAELQTARESRYTMDHGRGVVNVKSKFQGKDMDNTLKTGRTVHDFLSGLYYVRTLPLKTGDPICIDVVYFRYIWRVQGKVIGRERIQTPAGYFNTIVLDGTAVRTDDRKRRRDVSFWLTDDAYRVPVKAVSTLPMGETAVFASFIKKAGKPGEGMEEPAQDDGEAGE